MNNNLAGNGSTCVFGSRKTGVLILNRVVVPGFVVNLRCYERIPHHRYGYWNTSVESLNIPTSYDNLDIEEPNSPYSPPQEHSRGYWVSREEKARIDAFLRRFMEGMQTRIGGRVTFDTDMPSYYELKRGYGIVIYTNRGNDTDAKHVISELTGTPLADVLDVDEVRARFLREARVRSEQGYPLNYTGAPTRNIPVGSENVVFRNTIENGTEMVDLLYSTGRSAYPGSLFRRSTFERLPTRNGFRRHPLNRHSLAPSNVVPYIARVAPVVANAPALLANAPAVAPMNRNARRRLFANAAERRRRPAEGGRTRKSKKSRSRKH
jgi:hypothetical protein